jgi:hypothetical protein
MEPMSITSSRFLLLFAVLGVGCRPAATGDAAAGVETKQHVLETYADLMGCVFTSPEAAPVTSARAELIQVPEFAGRWAIWSSTGRDHRGHIWFGVSAHGVELPSAHLFEYDPETRVLTDRGDVVTELRQAGVWKIGEGQMKIHSKILQGADGNLYFSSYDEQGEATDGSRLPTWGGHFWRLRLPENRWEHLFAAKEALIAAAGGGRYMYVLGYFGHVLYQFDCETGQHRSMMVGSVGGHISRNFFCDVRGHVYVPRLRATLPGAPMVTSLVEFDLQLNQVGETRIDHYSQSTDEHSHGITGVQPLADGSIVFLTDQGFLYRVTILEFLPSKVEPLGWIHPAGKTYVASLFTSDGKKHLMAYCLRHTAEGERHEWLVFDLEARTSTALPLALPAYDGQPITNPLLYGSMTRDLKGACYLGGVVNRGTDIPLIMRVSREP